MLHNYDLTVAPGTSIRFAFKSKTHFVLLISRTAPGAVSQRSRKLAYRELCPRNSANQEFTDGKQK